MINIMRLLHLLGINSACSLELAWSIVVCTHTHTHKQNFDELANVCLGTIINLKFNLYSVLDGSINCPIIGLRNNYLPENLLPSHFQQMLEEPDG